MKFYLALLVVLAIPILLLVWRRYGHPGAAGTDAQAHKNLAKNGEAPNQGSSRPYR